MSNYDKLRELLGEETYPHRYLHKFIGLNTDLFRDEVERFEKLFPRAKKVSERESKGGGANAVASGQPPDAPSYVAFTYEFVANSPEEIIQLLEATSHLKDLRVML